MIISQLSRLLKALDHDPGNLDTLNSLAVWYSVFQPKELSPLVDLHDLATEDVRTLYELKQEWDAGNRSPLYTHTSRKAHDYFERAYQRHRTVRSTHNFARSLWQNHQREQGLDVQQQCLALSARSFLPYYQYGWMLFEEGRYGEAVPHLTAAYEREPYIEILHNTGVAHVGNGDFQRAKECFGAVIEAGLDSAGETSDDNPTTFNLALCEYKLGNEDEVKRIADGAVRRPGESEITSDDRALLYFLLGDYQRARDCDIDNDGLWWPGSPSVYAIYMTDEPLWREKVHNAIEGWSERMAGLSADPDAEQVNDFQANIDAFNRELRDGPSRPVIDLFHRFGLRDCGCLMFGCTLHRTRENDWLPVD